MLVVSKQRRIQKTLNDICIWAKLASLSLEVMEKDKGVIDVVSSFPVPSKIANKVVNRSPEAIVSTLQKARTSELYKALVVYSVSLVEPVLLEIVRLTLLFDKRRLKTKPKGCESKIDYDTIVDCDNYSEVINHIIAKYVDALGYSKLCDQLDYIEKLLGIDIDDDLWEQWIEIKATRDLIAHNNCMINNVYLDKAGTRARGELNKELVVDKGYFDNLIVVSKSLIGQIVSRILKKEKEYTPELV